MAEIKARLLGTGRLLALGFRTACSHTSARFYYAIEVPLVLEPQMPEIPIGSEPSI